MLGIDLDSELAVLFIKWIAFPVCVGAALLTVYAVIRDWRAK